MRDLYGLENLAFRRGNALELTAAGIGQFDIVLMLGLLYHTPDIVGVLRLARTLMKGICPIETQLAPESDAELQWGARASKQQIKGCFAVVDETQEIAAGYGGSWFGLDLPCTVAPGVDVFAPATRVCRIRGAQTASRFIRAVGQRSASDDCRDRAKLTHWGMLRPS
jgi:hypothetical protein